MKRFFKRLVAGMAIGAGGSIAGVSGAAIALILHVYNEIIDAVNNFRKKFKESIITLFPILIGIAIAVIICVYLFHLAFEYCMFLLICIFAGFLIGSMPGITDNVKGVPIKRTHVLFAIAGGLFVIALGALSVILGAGGNGVEEAFKTMPVWLYFVLIVVGAISAGGLTVPGFSGGLILLILGFYRPLMDNAVSYVTEILGVGKFAGAQSWSHFPQLILMLGSFAIGCVIGVALVSKVMSFLLNKHPHFTYFVIIGFILGSIVVLFFNYDIVNYYRVWAGQANPKIHPLNPIYIEMPVSLVVMGISMFLSYLLVKYHRKVVKEEEEEKEEIQETPAE